MKLDVAIVNAFVTQTQDGKSVGGNSAGVVLNADDLSHAQKLSIAKQVGLSETAFVSLSDVADFKLDFFTPTRQIAHCGHATIATFNLLASKGLIPQENTSKETIDGIRAVSVTDGSAFMAQLAPSYQALPEYQARVLSSLNLTSEEVSEEALLVNTGNSFLLVGVKDKQALANISPDYDLIQTISEELDLIGYYVFSLDTHLASSAATSRMFAPRYGILEEAATGMAAGPLACYLYDQKKVNQTSFIIEQGYAMKVPSPSLLKAELKLEDDEIKSLSVGGRAKVSQALSLDV
ncbi:phenazine biosynthesis protein [Marinomonas sp. SBI22]|uniref:PhzF family phenazine biosynthesis protein n=1 Tax=unclassified Marinomonas TaxID=196814 RepID=UPI0007AF32C8|nr:MULTISPECIES: PhzF family phenazine biosynthesis protein [unclassified Marinomonas]KZM42113.1 phenazine biosynthesis protein [Marinomonas sp. SBI22]KZM47043.1 phenazine biosynthesis protein [Marinomonas sp. SBI8L]